MIEVNENNRVDARQLHKALGSSRDFSSWIKYYIEKYRFKEGMDFSPNLGRSAAGRQTKEYELTIECAKHIAMVQNTEEGFKVRDYLINLDNQKQSGKLFNASEAAHLTKLINVMVIHEMREDALRKHFKHHNNKYTFHKHRDEILGYSSDTLKHELLKIGKQYKNKSQALMSLDKHELIRSSVIDLFIALNKSEEYAKNVGDFCYEVSKSIDLRFDKLDSMYVNKNKSIDAYVKAQKYLN